MSIMPIERIADFEKRLARQDAWWHREILDRPVVWIALPKPRPEVSPPAPRNWSSLRERWMDAAWVAESAVARVANTDYFGDALPTAWPNLGPEVFSAIFGQELEFGEQTSWSVPCLHDWAEVGRIRFSRENPYFRALENLTIALLEAGEGRFYVGMTDLHPGGDAIAAWRDPQEFAVDLLEHPDEVKRLLAYVTRQYFDFFDDFYNWLKREGQACTNWLGAVSTKKWYVPSNDFSCMVSKPMFDEFFLPGIIEECRHMEASIYHLDGPGALQHLDSLLAIPELNAIQWVYGAGHGRATDWLHVYRRIQAAGRGMQIWAEPDELETLMEHLRPEGVWLGVGGVRDAAQAEAIIARVARWR